MPVLYYFPLDAYSRITRLVMGEKMIEVKLQYELPWKLSGQFQKCNPYGMLPTLIDTINCRSLCVSGISAVTEYLEEVYPDTCIFGRTAVQRAESRQIAYWFISEFQSNVLTPIFQEKILKRFTTKSSSAPNPNVIRSAISNIPRFLEHMCWLLERRSWLAGSEFTIADISAASFISVLDYLGILQWNYYNEILLSWYVRIKSRRSFKPILSDVISIIPPSRNYSKIDY